MVRPMWLLLLALGAAACGWRGLPTEQHDAAVDDASHRDGPLLPDGFYNPACTEDSNCRVAVRTDNCCEAAYPEKIWVIDFDPCLEYWSVLDSVSVPQQCRDAWDPQCAYVDCMPAPPPSRTARCNQGQCEFAAECASASDCVLVIDTRQCCPCPAVVPRGLYLADECLLGYPNAVGPTGCEPTACPAMPCPVCEVPTANCLGQTCQGIVPH